MEKGIAFLMNLLRVPSLAVMNMLVLEKAVSWRQIPDCWDNDYNETDENIIIYTFLVAIVAVLCL
jgi:hypothetical protein